MRLNRKCQALQKGFIFLPILLTLTLVAVVAILVTRESSMQAEQIVRDQTPTQDRYVGLAGLEIGQKQLQSDLDCTNYQIDATNSFANTSFASTVSATSGSPITLNVNVDPNGSNLNFSREITMFDANSPAPDITLSVVEGTYLRSDEEEDNYNNSNTWHVKHNLFSPDRVSLMKFDLSSVDVPIEYIISATLEMHSAGSAESQTHTVNVHRITVDWDESEATYEERLEDTEWQNSDLDWNAVSSTTVDESVVGWKYFDVTELVKGWLNEDYPNHGLELVGQFLTSNNLEFVSDQNSDSSKHPVLRIKYLCECGKVCSTSDQCDADFIPTQKVDEIDMDAYGADDITGLAYLPEGALFNGTTSPERGAWLTLDENNEKIYMSNMDGAKISERDVPGLNPSGLTRITSGTYEDHFAMTDRSTGLLYILDASATTVTSFSLSVLGASTPMGVTFVETSQSGLYESNLAVLHENGRVIIVDQAGGLVATLNFDALGLDKPEGIAHLTGTDKFLIADKGIEQVVTMNFAETWLTHYALNTFSAENTRAIGINTLTCDHALAVDGPEKLFLVNQSESGGTATDAVFETVADTHINDRWSKRNKEYGGNTSLEISDGVGDKENALLKFDVSTIPAGSTINSVKLRMYVHISNLFLTNLEIYKALTDWTEAGANWNNMGDSEDMDTTLQGGILLASFRSDWIEIDLPTTLVDEWLADSSVQDKGLFITAPLGAISFKSRQSGPFYAPRLEVNYTSP